jgi:hypothetical protein
MVFEHVLDGVRRDREHARGEIRFLSARLEA